MVAYDEVVAHAARDLTVSLLSCPICFPDTATFFFLPFLKPIHSQFYTNNLYKQLEERFET